MSPVYRCVCVCVCVCVCSAGGDEYCHNEEFAAECYDGEVILMTSAVYGRMAVGRCVKTDFGFVGCYKDVIAELHERCSGRPYCSVGVPDTKLDSTSPCHDDLKSYLQATYVCITGLYQSDQSTAQFSSAGSLVSITQNTTIYQQCLNCASTTFRYFH